MLASLEEYIGEAGYAVGRDPLAERLIDEARGALRKRMGRGSGPAAPAATRALYPSVSPMIAASSERPGRSAEVAWKRLVSAASASSSGSRAS